MFGKVYDRDGKLLADHQNLPPAKLDPAHNPLHAFYNTGGGLAQLSDFNENNPAVLDYLAGAYEQWIDQGADAFRIDTIGWMPDSFWHQFTTRIRAKHPGFFMFGEAFDYDAGKIAQHTWPQNAGVSVLDFPLKQGLERSLRPQARRLRAAGAAAVPGQRAVCESVRADDLLRQPRHAAPGCRRCRFHRRAQLAVHRARHPGRLLRFRNRIHARPRRARRQPQLFRAGAHRRRARQSDPRIAEADRAAARNRRPRCSAACNSTCGCRATRRCSIASTSMAACSRPRWSAQQGRCATQCRSQRVPAAGQVARCASMAATSRTLPQMRCAGRRASARRCGCSCMTAADRSWPTVQGSARREPMAAARNAVRGVRRADGDIARYGAAGKLPAARRFAHDQ